MKAVIDIGGTNLRLGASADNMTLAFVERIATPQSFTEAMRLIAAHYEGKPLTQAVVGVAGVVDRAQGILKKSPHLPDWNNRELARELGAALHTIVQIENDTALAALGEACAGAGKGFSIIAYISVGTGVGGARVVNCTIDVASQGFEPGHQLVGISDKPWPYCGQSGCWESFVSGTVWSGREQALTDEYYQYFIRGAVNVAALWSPDIIIIGGGFGRYINADRVAQGLAQQLPLFVPIPVRTSVLGDQAALLGGLWYHG